VYVEASVYWAGAYILAQAFNRRETDLVPAWYSAQYCCSLPYVPAVPFFCVRRTFLSLSSLTLTATIAYWHQQVAQKTLNHRRTFVQTRRELADMLRRWRWHHHVQQQ